MISSVVGVGYSVGVSSFSVVDKVVWILFFLTKIISSELSNSVHFCLKFSTAKYKFITKIKKTVAMKNRFVIIEQTEFSRFAVSGKNKITAENQKILKEIARVKGQKKIVKLGNTHRIHRCKRFCWYWVDDPTFLSDFIHFLYALFIHCLLITVISTQ